MAYSGARGSLSILNDSDKQKLYYRISKPLDIVQITQIPFDIQQDPVLLNSLLFRLNFLVERSSVFVYSGSHIDEQHSARSKSVGKSKFYEAFSVDLLMRKCLSAGLKTWQIVVLKEVTYEVCRRGKKYTQTKKIKDRDFKATDLIANLAQNETIDARVQFKLKFSCEIGTYVNNQGFETPTKCAQCCFQSGIHTTGEPIEHDDHLPEYSKKTAS